MLVSFDQKTLLIRKEEPFVIWTKCLFRRMYFHWFIGLKKYNCT